MENIAIQPDMHRRHWRASRAPASQHRSPLQRTPMDSRRPLQSSGPSRCLVRWGHHCWRGGEASPVSSWIRDTGATHANAMAMAFL